MQSFNTRNSNSGKLRAIEVESRNLAWNDYTHKACVQSHLYYSWSHVEALGSMRRRIEFATGSIWMKQIWPDVHWCCTTIQTKATHQYADTRFQLTLVQAQSRGVSGQVCFCSAVCWNSCLIIPRTWRLREFCTSQHKRMELCRAAHTTSSLVCSPYVNEKTNNSSRYHKFFRLWTNHFQHNSKKKNI